MCDPSHSTAIGAARSAPSRLRPTRGLRRLRPPAKNNRRARRNENSHDARDLCFDVVSPFAYLLDATLRRAELPLALDLKPVLFAGLLNAHGTKGPAEVPRKRTCIYEFCTFRAHVCGIPFQMPAVHPFNPLRYLRLIIALGATREATSAVFDALYATGADPEAPATWRGVAQTLGVADPDALIETRKVKQQLRDNTDAAIAAGVFGVPTILVGDRLFWGEDSLPMLTAYLSGDPVFDTPQMQAARRVRLGAQRRQAKQEQPAGSANANEGGRAKR